MYSYEYEEYFYKVIATLVTGSVIGAIAGILTNAMAFGEACIWVASISMLVLLLKEIWD